MLRKKTKFLGFTLIELLVVVAIIGMLSSTIMAGVGRARMKARDSKRLSDMDQIRKGMDLYLSQSSGYPDTAAWTAGNVTCSGNQILRVPHDPGGMTDYTYAVDNSSGGTVGNCGDTVYPRYYVRFQTELPTTLGAAGTYYLTPSGSTGSAPF
ncbi:MAG: type II secretion system protein [Candidatus Saccharibacteria bacterium]